MSGTSGLIYVVTGSESGIGAATPARLRADGHRVIGVDRTETDVTADLGTAAGRADAVARVTALAPDGIAGLVPCVGAVLCRCAGRGADSLHQVLETSA